MNWLWLSVLCTGIPTICGCEFLISQLKVGLFVPCPTSVRAHALEARLALDKLVATVEGTKCAKSVYRSKYICSATYPITESEINRYVGVDVGTLENLRVLARGPKSRQSGHSGNSMRKSPGQRAEPDVRSITYANHIELNAPSGPLLAVGLQPPF